MTRHFSFGLGVAAALLLAGGAAHAQNYTMCPSQAASGGISATWTAVAGPLDGSGCTGPSAMQGTINQSTDYARLLFDPTTPNYPSPLSLGSLGGAAANVVYSTAGSDNPYFMLAFSAPDINLGQTAPGDQLLMIEFQPTTLSGSSLNIDPYSTKFNLYDNQNAGFYMLGGQQDTNTLAGWLSLYPALGNEAISQIRIAAGLTGSPGTGPESLTVNSLDVRVPEPMSMMLLGAALGGLAAVRRRRR